MTERRRNTLILPAALLALLFFGLRGLEAQDGLYGAAAPRDAAFVRVMHVADADPLTDLWVGARRFSLVEPHSVTAYRPAGTGIFQIMVGGKSDELIARAGEYYTVLYSDQGLSVLHDTAHTRPDRSQLVLYNVSGLRPLELRTADGETPVITGVEPGRSGVTAVNPIRIEFALYHQGAMVALVGDPGLERGQSYSIVLVESGDTIRTIVQRAEIELE